MKNKDIMLKVCVLLLTVILLVYSSNSKKSGDRDNKSDTLYDFAMGTSVSVTIYSGDKMSATDADNLARQIVEEIKALDTELISWREETSELAILNEHLAASEEQEAYDVSAELYEVLSESYSICEDSAGALDITIRPLLDCWGIENASADTFDIPSDGAIKAALADVGYEKISIAGDEKDNPEDDSKKYSVRCTSKEGSIIIDLGSTGKGYALDVVRKTLDKLDVKGAIIAVGGSIMAYGEKGDGTAWKIGIRDPRGSVDEMLGYLEISCDDYICVSTSGDYEKYIEKNGARYHHILDRDTGYPADSGLSSVTIVCKSGTDSDGLSTACFVLGMEASKKLLQEYDAEAVFVDLNGVVTVTDGLKDYYKGN